MKFYSKGYFLYKKYLYKYVMNKLWCCVTLLERPRASGLVTVYDCTGAAGWEIKQTVSCVQLQITIAHLLFLL